LTNNCIKNATKNARKIMKSLKKKFQILILVVIFNSFINCDITSETSNSSCCGNTTDKRVVVEFTSNVVQHEFIVQFKNYYTKDSRAKFLTAALESSQVI
jgi:hypothetical protein